MQVSIYLSIWTRHSLLAKKYKDNFSIESFSVHTHSFIFVPAFSLGRVAGSEIPHDQRLLSHRCSQQDLPRQSFLGDSGHVAEPITWDLSIRRSGVIFRALRMSNLCSLSRRVTPWTLRKNPISAACSWESILLVVTRGSWPQVRIGRKTDLKTERFAIFESSRFHHGATKLT